LANLLLSFTGCSWGQDHELDIPERAPEASHGGNWSL
jgi:hypothetical protein